MDILRGEIAALLAADGAPGASVAVIVDGEAAEIVVGRAAIDGDEPLTADARFPWYSVTKTMIAAIVLREGIDLDAPIQRFVPELAVAEPVPVRRVLDHSGGLPDYGGMRAYQDAVREHPGTPWSDDAFLARTLGNGLAYPPGAGWAYSNIGYLLLRLAIERVTGGSFRAAVLDLAAAAGLGEIDVVTTREGMAALTPGWSGEPPWDVTTRYHPGWVAHGLVEGTARGMAAFLDRLVGGGIVGQEALAAKLSPVRVPHEHPLMTAPSYGFGLMLDPEHRFGRVAGHTGGGPGYATAAYHFPDVAGRRVTVGAMVNRDGGDTATAIAFRVAAALAGVE